MAPHLSPTGLGDIGPALRGRIEDFFISQSQPAQDSVDRTDRTLQHHPLLDRPNVSRGSFASKLLNSPPPPVGQELRLPSGEPLPRLDLPGAYFPAEAPS